MVLTRGFGKLLEIAAHCGHCPNSSLRRRPLLTKLYFALHHYTLHCSSHIALCITHCNMHYIVLLMEKLGNSLLLSSALQCTGMKSYLLQINKTQQRNTMQSSARNRNQKTQIFQTYFFPRRSQSYYVSQ